MKGGERVIVGNDYVGIRSRFQDAKFTVKIPRGNLCIIGKQHFGDFRPRSRGIAGVMLVQNIRNLVRFKHIARIAVRTEPDQNAALKDFQHRRAADCIAHIRFGVMHDHRIRFFQ